VEEVLVVSHCAWVANHDVVQLHVVEGVAGLVNQLDLVKELKANLVAARGGESFVSGE
jgi:hypothetical protein